MFELLIYAKAKNGRLPNKHLQRIGSKAVIEYAYDCAVSARTPDHIYMMTDCPVMARLAGDYGIEHVPLDPEVARTGHCTDDVVGPFIDWWEKRWGSTEGHTFGHIPGNFLIFDKTVVDRAYHIKQETAAENVTILEPGEYQYSGVVYLNDDGTINHREQSSNTMARRNPPRGTAYWHGGALHLYNWPYVAGKTMPVMCDRYTTKEIDDEIDLETARAIAMRHATTANQTQRKTA